MGQPITPKDNEGKLKLRRFLKRWLKEATGCCIQHDGWTCGTCFYAFLDSIGIPEPLQHGFWQVVLAVRGDYDDFDWQQAEKHDGVLFAIGWIEKNWEVHTARQIHNQEDKKHIIDGLKKEIGVCDNGGS